MREAQAINPSNDRQQRTTCLFAIADGGIGGLAAALAWCGQGRAVKVSEQAVEIGAIGAGIRMGSHAIAAFDASGIGEEARTLAVHTDTRR